jgi:cytoskeletal protein CcmA (bactofilin family)
VDGIVEGTITLTDSRLTVGSNARVQANVSARDVIILGALTGDIIATGRVELRAGANLKGDIRAARLSVEENAVLSGKVELSSSERSSTSHVSSPAPSASAPSAAPSGALFPSTK